MNKYVLIGITSSGKTAIGQRAAEILQMPFYNTSKLAWERVNFDNPGKVFTHSGRYRLEAEQRELMAEYAKLDGSAIIEVWPECPLEPWDADVAKSLGTIIYIKREAEAALSDVLKKERRIILKEVNTGHEIDMEAEAVRLYAKEVRHFEDLADLTLDNNGSEDEAVEKLVAMIREREGPPFHC